MDPPPTAPRRCGRGSCQTILPAGSSHKICDHHREQFRLSKKRQRDAEKSKENPSATQKAKSEGGRAARRLLGTGNINVEDDESENSQEVDSSADEGPTKLRKTAVEYANLSSLLSHLHTSIETAERANECIIFSGHYSCPSRDVSDMKEYASEVAHILWKTIGYRFTHHDYRHVKHGTCKRMWCCQSKKHAKAPKASTNPDTKHRDTVGFDRFPCDGSLLVSVRPHPRLKNHHRTTLTFKHKQGHVRYLDVSMPPDALAYIKSQLRSTPGLIASQLVTQFPHVTQPQVYSAWTRLSEAYWKKDEDAIVSARKLLLEDKHGVDFWELEVPEGVTAIAWGCRRILKKIGSATVEIGLDATYNTNEANLELYTVIAEVDNAGYPLAYCLLSTATAISPRKRSTSLKAFLHQIKRQYEVNPAFTHVDKDFAEISALGVVWPAAKIQICFWHLKRAITERMSKPGLKTTPYNVTEAREEFGFINPSFVPTTSADPKDNEEYGYGSDAEYQPNAKKVTKRKKAPAESKLPPPLHPQQLSQINPNALRITISIPPSFIPPQTQATDSQSTQSTDSEADSDAERNAPRRQFCPPDLRDAVTTLIERHYCAHPSIPGYARPDAESIRWWAVEEMYGFCVRNGLRELWAYLWANWYRPTRWILWARSTCAEIARLKTTMIVESHWRRVKSDFLSHNHKPRLDYLAWILIKRLMPTYEDLLETRLTYTGRHRRLPAWRKAFKKEWKRCAVTPITDPEDDTYNPLPYRWVCTCPAFVKSRFLICKHLVQLVHLVPPRFFQQVSRERSCPIWRHADLRPLGPPPPGDLMELVKSSAGMEVGGRDRGGNGGSDDGNGESSEDGSDSGSDGEEVAGDSEGESDEEEAERKQVKKEMQDIAQQLRDLAGVLDYNAQYTDRRALQMFTRKTKASVSLIKKVQKLEKLVQSRTSPNPPTFSPAFADLMFVRTRPRSLTTQA